MGIQYNTTNYGFFPLVIISVGWVPVWGGKNLTVSVLVSKNLTRTRSRF
jgi:hypothetical protein